jgi:hypothetical protein
MPILLAPQYNLKPVAEPQHCHIYSKCRAIQEHIELLRVQSDEDAVKRDKLSGRTDNLSGEYYRGRVIVNAVPRPCSETTVSEPR